MIKRVLFLALLFNPILGYGDNIDNPKFSRVPKIAVAPHGVVVTGGVTEGLTYNEVQTIDWADFNSLLSLPSGASNWIVATDAPYNFSTGNTPAQNKAALQAAVEAAEGTGNPVYLGPDGTYPFDPGIVISDTVRIFGSGRNCILDCSAAGDTTHSAITFDAYCEALLHDFKLLGPTLVAPVNQSRGILLADSTGTDNDAETLKVGIKNVEIEGFRHSTYTIAEEHGLEVGMLDCYFHDAYQYSATFWTDTQTTPPNLLRELFASNCVFADNSNSHLWYIHPNTKVIFEGCTFTGATSYAIQWQTGSNNVAQGTQVVSNCLFKDNTGYIVTANNSSNRLGRVIIDSNTFDGSTGNIEFRSSGVFSNNMCIIKNLSSAFLVAGQSFDIPAHVVASGNIFHIQEVSGFAGPVVSANNLRSVFNYTGNSIWLDDSITGGVVIALDVGDVSDTSLPTANIKNNSFVAESATQQIDISLGNAIVNFEGNYVKGDSQGDRGLITFEDTPNASARININYNKFDVTGGSNKIYIGTVAGDSPNSGNKIFAKNNEFLGGGVFKNSEVAAQWLISPGKGNNPVSVASAATVNLDPTYDVHILTGTTQVDTINFFPSGSTAPEDMGAGKQNLVVEAGVLFSGAGNIANGPYITRQAGVLSFLFDHVNDNVIIDFQRHNGDFAELFVTSNVVATVIAGSSSDWTNAVKVEIFTGEGPENGADGDAAADHITIDKDGVYRIVCNLSIDDGNGNVYSFSAFEDSALTSPLVPRATQTFSNAEKSNAICEGFALLSSGDVLDVLIQNETNTDNVLIEDISFSVELIH